MAFRLLSGVLATLVLCAPAAFAAEIALGPDSRTDLTLTLYQQNFAHVTEERRVQLPGGESRLAIEGLGRALRPESVLVEAPSLRVAAQRYDNRLLTPRRLLEAAVGKRVLVVRTHPETGEQQVTEAELLSIAEGPVLSLDGRIETVSSGRIAFPELPGDLRERATLLVDVTSDGDGERTLKLDYLTGGFGWSADYVARFDGEAETLDLKALVSLENTSGAAFRDARLRLVAGDVNTVQPPPEPREMMAADVSRVQKAVPAARSESVADRQLFTLPGRYDLADQESRQVPLFTAANVAATSHYRFRNFITPYPQGEVGPINASLEVEVENTAGNGLGQPLPAGTVRVYETAGDGADVFAGESGIGHIPEGERMELTLGSAFDVTARARHLAFERLSREDGSFESGQEIVVANAKDRAVTVELIGNFPGSWQILEESHPHATGSAEEPRWTLDVPAGGETTLTYRVRVRP